MYNPASPWSSPGGGVLYSSKGSGKGGGYAGAVATNQVGLYTMGGAGQGMQQNLVYGNTNQNKPPCNGCGILVLITSFVAIALLATAVVLRAQHSSITPQQQAQPMAMPAPATGLVPPAAVTASTPIVAASTPAVSPVSQPVVSPAMTDKNWHQSQIPHAYGDPAAHSSPNSAPAPAQLVPKPLSAAERSKVIGLADHIADEEVLLRCMPNNSQREIVEDLFNGTYVAGGGKFGDVALSPKAQLLKDTLVKKGFKHRMLYHGTMMPALKPILNGGFLCPHAAFRGMGIYAAGTLSHAECYSDTGNPVLHLEVYYKEDKDDRYISKVFAANEMADSFIVTDPLAIFPKEVIECCPVRRTCM